MCFYIIYCMCIIPQFKNGQRKIIYIFLNLTYKKEKSTDKNQEQNLYTLANLLNFKDKK